MLLSVLTQLHVLKYLWNQNLEIFYGDFWLSSFLMYGDVVLVVEVTDIHLNHKDVLF